MATVKKIGRPRVLNSRQAATLVRLVTKHGPTKAVQVFAGMKSGVKVSDRTAARYHREAVRNSGFMTEA